LRIDLKNIRNLYILLRFEELWNNLKKHPLKDFHQSKESKAFCETCGNLLEEGEALCKECMVFIKLDAYIKNISENQSKNSKNQKDKQNSTELIKKDINRRF
jgi:hypothetical protein